MQAALPACTTPWCSPTVFGEAYKALLALTARLMSPAAAMHVQKQLQSDVRTAQDIVDRMVALCRRCYKLHPVPDVLQNALLIAMQVLQSKSTRIDCKITDCLACTDVQQPLSELQNLSLAEGKTLQRAECDVLFLL